LSKIQGLLKKCKLPTHFLIAEGKTAEAEDGEGLVESKLANNIDSVLAVLEKVENPQAQQAIMKNIQKSFEKIEKKFKKLQEADAKFAEKMAEIK
jgi:RecA-family ATPase